MWPGTFIFVPNGNYISQTSQNTLKVLQFQDLNNTTLIFAIIDALSTNALQIEAKLFVLKMNILALKKQLCTYF